MISESKSVTYETFTSSEGSGAFMVEVLGRSSVNAISSKC